MNKLFSSLTVFIIVVQLLVYGCNGHTYVIDNNIMDIPIISNNIVNEQSKGELYNYLLLSQNSDGGFGGLLPATLKTPDIYSTFYSLSALSELSALDMMGNKQLTIDWLTDSLQTDISSETDDATAINDLFYNIASLNFLNQKIDDKAAIINLLNTYKDPNGAYNDIVDVDYQPNNDDYIYSTAQAVSILTIIGEPVEAETRNWLISTWNERDSLNIVAVYQLYNALLEIGIQPEISDTDIAKAKAILESSNTLAEINAALVFIDDVSIYCETISKILDKLYHQNGSFSDNILDEANDPQSVYLALKIYNRLNLTTPDKDAILNYLLNTQSKSGGFHSSYYCGSQGITTYYAVMIMEMIGASIPDGVNTYVNDCLELENSPTDIYPLLLISEAEGIDISLSQECISNINEIVNDKDTVDKEGLCYLYCSLYILKKTNYEISTATISTIQEEIDDLEIFSDSYSVEESGIFSLYYAIKIYQLLDLDVPFEQQFLSCIEQNQASDGTFQIAGYTDVVLNYLIIDILENMEYKIKNREGLIRWIQQCGNYYYGFQMLPGSSIENDTDPLLSTFAALYICSALNN
ncbi:MAG: prenyltransferase/squalene oxidase repeat-containing protein [Eubacteriales bacterium]